MTKELPHAKSYTAGRYQDWYAEKVFEQLNRGVQAHDVRVDARLSTVKPLHARLSLICTNT